MDYKKAWNEIKQQLKNTVDCCQNRGETERVECYKIVFDTMETMEDVARAVEEVCNNGMDWR